MSLARLESITKILTIVAAAAAAAVSLVTAFAIGQFALAAGVLMALLLRLRGPSENWRHAGAVGLVLAVAAVVGVGGGPGSPLLILLLFVMADFGLTQSARTAVLVGIAAALLTGLAASLLASSSVAGPDWIWSLGLVPLVGLTAAQLGGRQSLDGTAALESASAALDEVLTLAERMPAGFDRWSVATAVHLELIETSRLADRPGPVPHLLLVQQGVLFGVGAPIAREPVGLVADIPTQRRGRTWGTVEREQLPDLLASSLDGPRWYVHRLGGDGAHGVVLVPHDIHPAALDATADVLRPAGAALANVDRFERLEALAVSAARTRVAHDLHDGVAQALTHVRFELDLLALEREDLTDDIERIRRVADAALLDVRRTVGELRDTAPIGDRIRRHVELLSPLVVAPIELELPADVDLPPSMADHVFRFVQEALSNAVRHAGAETIRVVMAGDERSLSVLVMDDGMGMPAPCTPGVGLGAMEERARRLGGSLTIRPRRGGGVVVELDVPIRRSTAASAVGAGDVVGGGAG